MYEATDWLTEHVRAKRRDEEEADKIGDLFMSRGDLDAIEPFLGDGAKVIGHGLLVAKDGQTLAFMRLLSANGEGGAPGGAPAASATTPAQLAPAPAAEGPNVKPVSPLKDPGDNNSYLNDTGKKIVDIIGGVISPNGGLSRFGEAIGATGDQVNGLKKE